MKRCLIACEFSGIVRDAFAAKGWDAWSCDLLPSERPGQHVVGNYDNYKWDEWDLDMTIAHPPCTLLCNSGVRWLAPSGVLDPERHRLMELACDFFASLYWSDSPKVAVENPIMHKYARDYLASAWKVPAKTQTIQPWQFGHGETKATCLWLRGLPPLKPTNIVDGRHARVHREPPSPDRWKNRSRTYPGIAAAMAEQWGCL